MCQGCEDFIEWEKAVDELILRELPRAMAQPIDRELLMGKKVDGT